MSSTLSCKPKAALTGAFYLRLVGKPLEVYQYLEPLYNDYRKLRTRNAEGHFGLSHMDELIDDMLKQEYLFDVALPRNPLKVSLPALAFTFILHSIKSSIDNWALHKSVRE